MVKFYKLLSILILAFAALQTETAAQSVPAGGRLTVETETLTETPFEQEMILIKIRGYYPYTIALNTLEQPAFRNFGWMQLGRDRWFEISSEQLRGFERVMAIFPRRPGNLKIEPFVHHFTLIGSDGRRIKHDVASNPLTIKVRAKPASPDWWLPAKRVRVNDSWDRDPATLGLGQPAVRTVILEAEGVGPEMLPPIPPMRVPNLITFSDPGERTTILTPQGPISRVVWRWTFKPATSLPADLETVIIPWFDTVTRENREVMLAPRRVALAGGTGSLQKPGSSLLGFAHYAMPAGLVLGLLAGLTLVMPGLKLKSRKTIGTTLRRFAPDRHIWALHFATWQNDARKVRWLMRRILLDDRRTGQDRNLRAQISMIDASLYGYAGAVIRPLGLRCIVRKFLAARRCEMQRPDNRW